VPPLRGDTGGVGEQFAVATVILDDSLWISGSPIDCDWLRQERIDLVVDVADPQLRLDPLALGTIVYCKEALIDGVELPPSAILGRLVEDVVAAVRAGRRVLVACAGGRNRSGLVVGLAVRELLGCSGAQALTWVQSRREAALNNATFSRHLAGLPPTINP
jgi:protein-tyrosine phosphatase